MSDKPDDSLDQQVEDARFLSERFDIVPRKAAGLVSREGVDSDTIRQGVEAAAEDPLEGEPVPAEPKRDFVADSDEVRLKPVLHRGNRRSGAG